MITLNTLAKNTVSKFNFRQEHFIVQKDTEALVNKYGRTMIEKLSVGDPRNDAMEAWESLEAEVTGTQPRSGVVRTLPVTYVRMLFDQSQGGTLHNHVATFRSHERAKQFMQQHNLRFPAFKVVSEKRVLEQAVQQTVQMPEEKFRSNPSDWERRGYAIPVGYFKGRPCMHKFHHRNRMIRDQAYAHLRGEGIFNPSRGQINDLMGASTVDFAINAK